MSPHRETFLKKLEAALESLDRASSARLADELIASFLEPSPRQGGRVEMLPGEIRSLLGRRQQLEEVLGAIDGARAAALRWLVTGLERCRGLAHLSDRLGNGRGTGLLVRGGDLHPSLGDELLLLTSVRAAAGETVVGFEVTEERAGRPYRVAEVLWISPPDDLDAALLRLDPPVVEADGAPLAPSFPEDPVRACVLDHAAGRGGISLSGIPLLGLDAPRVRYAAPLEAANPGSPLFDDQWRLIALHHADREATSIHAIVRRLAEAWGEEAPWPAPPAAQAVPEKPLPVHENVQFTVYRPRVVAPLEWCPLLVFAHLEALADEPESAVEAAARMMEEIEDQARSALGESFDGYRDDTEDSSHAIPHEAEITFVPEVPGFRFNPPRATFLWLEAVHREEFRMQASPQLDGQVARGRLSVFWGRILVAELNLKIEVDSRLAVGAPTAAAERDASRPYHDIFASYSHKDTALVAEFERYFEALGHRYLIDRKDLRAGQVWDERLQGMIRGADVFQLFWSHNAMRSPFVEQEWRYALSLGREGFVRPTYWEEPLPELPDRGLPPAELRRIHFHLFSRGAAERPAMAPAAPVAPAASRPPEPEVVASPTRAAAPRRRRSLAWAGSLAAALFVLVLGPLVLGTREEDASSWEPEGSASLPSTSETESVDTAPLPPPPPPPPPPPLAEVTIDLGHSLAVDGTIALDQQGDDFAPGDPVYLALDFPDVPAGSTVEVVWTGPDGTVLAEEAKTVAAGPPLSFEVHDTAAWAPGDYRAAVLIDGETIAEQGFAIVEAAEREP